MARIGQTVLLACLLAVPAANAARDAFPPLHASLVAHLGLAHPLVGQALSATSGVPAATEACP